MTKEYILRKLKEQKKKSSQGDFETWLTNTQTFIQEYFGILSNRTSNFQSIIGDYRIQKIGDVYAERIDKQHFKNKALQLIDEYIEYIEEQEDEPTKIEPMKKKIKSFAEFDDNTENTSSSRVFPLAPVKKKPLPSYPLEFPQACFGLFLLPALQELFSLVKELARVVLTKKKLIIIMS